MLDAKVTATIHLPSSSSSSGSTGSEIVELTLRDDGSGWPDVTSGDGVYSAAFSGFSSVPGFYSVGVRADDNGGMARTVGRKTTEQQEAEKGTKGENGYYSFGRIFLIFFVHRLTPELVELFMWFSIFFLIPF